MVFIIAPYHLNPSMFRGFFALMYLHLILIHPK